MSSLGPYRTAPKLPVVVGPEYEARPCSIADDIVRRCAEYMRNNEQAPTLVVVSRDDYEAVLAERDAVARATAFQSLAMGRLKLHTPSGIVSLYVGNVTEPVLGWYP